MFLTMYGLVATCVVVAVMGLRLWRRDRRAAQVSALVEARFVGIRSVQTGRVLDELELGYWERVVGPKWVELREGVARRITPGNFQAELREKLQSAGMKLSAEEFFLYRVAGAVAGGSVAGLATWRLAQLSEMERILLPIAVLCVVYLLPGIHVNTKAQKRIEEIERGLPEVFDLLSVSVEAGLAFDGAMRRVVSNTVGPVQEEFSRVLSDMQLGVPRVEALGSLAARTHSRQLKRFAGLIAQSDRTGSGIGLALKTQARDIKDYREAKAKEKAASIPIKIIFPMVIFIFPAIFLIILGPAVISVLKLLHP